MDIQHNYIHSSHSDTTSSVHYASKPAIQNSTFISLVKKEQQKLHSLQQEEEPINTPIPQQVSITAPSIIQNDAFTSFKQVGDDGRTTLKSIDGSPFSQATTTVSSTYTPAMYLATRDKRKSSPAVLGLLGLGEEQEAKLGQQLSLHRNSIEAAMLLANFNRPQTKPSSPVSENKEKATWKDAMSVGSNCNHDKDSSWENIPPCIHRQRRYSFDSKMSWESMPKQFLDQASLLQELKTKPINVPSSSIITATTTSSSSAISSPRIRSKTWYSESMEQEQKLQGYHKYQDGPPFQSSSGAAYHTIYASSQPLPSSDQPVIQQPYRQPPSGYYPYPYPYPHPHPYSYPHPPSQSQQHYYFPNKLPLSSNNNTTEENNGMMMQSYHPHPGYPPMIPPHLHPLHPIQYHPYQLQHLQQQSQAMTAAAMAAPTVKPKRKRRDHTEDDENVEHVMPGDPDFPDMAESDVEAARNDVEARPRRQKLRYIGDMYTPQWVRYNGQSKEGLCDTCKPGKWLQLKNSAFWYHKQFFHGISSVSGTEFMKPMDTRWVDQDIVEGLCHQCQQWVSVSNVKRKNSVLWYRHAHKCHVYHKPKNGSPKRS